MIKKSLSVILAILMIATTLVISGAVFAEDTDSFQAGDTVYFDCSDFIDWTTASAIEYINFTEYTRADNGGSVVIESCDKTKYNPVMLTDKINDYQYSYTFTEETAGAKCLRFWRGNTEKLWNNSPLLTYEMFKEGKNCVKVSDFDGNGTVCVFGSAPVTSSTEEKTTSSKEDTSTTQPGGDSKFSYAQANQLYVHGVMGNSADTEAWEMWEREEDGNFYFFLPSSADKNSIEVYNTFKNEVTVGDVKIPANSVVTMDYSTSKTYTVNTGSSTEKLKIMRSGAECAVYVNNSSKFNGVDMYTYLCQDKSNTANGSGAVTESDGTLTNTPVKKIKGRGNTSWGKTKKSFNITYDSALKISGMDKTKKYSICANYQDDSLSRNRFLYDLGNQVGLPYSPQSRFADFYINGVYMGSYQMCQKVEVGNDELIGDLTGDDHIAPDGKLAADFPFAFKIDSGIDYDDFWFTAGNNSIIVVSPELADGDPYYNEVRQYISEKFEEMFTALKNNSANLYDLIDPDSFAKIYLINELGKNWDVGVSSFYFVYKQDKDGKYRFFASPPWDYDNALGNAIGVSSDLNGLGVRDYTLPTGEWVSRKGGKSNVNNVASLMYKNTLLKKRISEVWYESFVPAIEFIFNKTNINTGSMYSSDVYYQLIKDSAAMNYASGRLINPEPQWIAYHGSLNKCFFDYSAKEFRQASVATEYDVNSFEGVYNYCVDWLNSRASYLSNLFVDSYIEPKEPTKPTDPTDVSPTTPSTTMPEEHEIQEGTLIEFAFDNYGKISEEKLTEYGDKNGYKATFGQADLLLSMDGIGNRALEWSAAEYGVGSDTIVPIMSAGSKNPWGDNPYIQVSFDATQYTDLSFSMEMAGSNKAPANWKLQYSLDGTSFNDIENTSYTISADNRKIMTEYIKDIKLPQECNGAENVIIRAVPTSKVTIAGGNYDDAPTSGEIAINNIRVMGNSAKEPIAGDINLDGNVTVQDATTIQKYSTRIVKLTTLQIAAGDFNKDGKVNIRDSTAIQKFIAGLLPDE